ncbi:MAG: SiaB family protein kinase [Bacteroidales bacterium]|nr:SiaB family protein kinase [Bacteroidales bacterium]
MDNSTFSFFEKFSQDNFCMLYDGNIVDDVTDKIIDLSEYHFENQEDYDQSRKKVSFLLAECFQNIIRHGGSSIQETNKKSETGFFLTRNFDNTYFITSGNLIKNEKVHNLKAQLEKVNSLDKENLKALYLEVLQNKEFSEKGGAGLGLIEIARKSGQKIEYLFVDYNDDFSIFYSQVMLKPKNQFIENSGYHIIQSIEFHRKMMMENILLIQRGGFSRSSVLPILEILKKNLSGIFLLSHPRREAYHILVELIQNIGKYAVEEMGKKAGIFIIRKIANNFIISAGNYVKEIHIEPLKKQIDFLNSLSEKELKAKYLSALNEEEKQIRIELIDIARRSNAPIQYNFTETNFGRHFFTISVEV